MKHLLVLMSVLIFNSNLFATDTELGGLVAVERKVTVQLSECEKNWNTILKECSVTITEKGVATDFTLPGQELYQRLVVNEQKCGVGMSLQTNANGFQGYYLRFVGMHGSNTSFAEARPCLERALETTGGVVSAKVFIVK